MPTFNKSDTPETQWHQVTRDINMCATFADGLYERSLCNCAQAMLKLGRPAAALGYAMAAMQLRDPDPTPKAAYRAASAFAALNMPQAAAWCMLQVRLRYRHGRHSSGHGCVILCVSQATGTARCTHCLCFDQSSSATSADWKSNVTPAHRALNSA